MSPVFLLSLPVWRKTMLPGFGGFNRIFDIRQTIGQIHMGIL